MEAINENEGAINENEGATTPERSYSNELIRNKYYTDKHRKAQQKYREKNRDKYNVSQRELYMRLHQNEEWREMFNERSKKNNLIARQRKREQLLRTNPDIEIRGRGRPRKLVVNLVNENP